VRFKHVNIMERVKERERETRESSIKVDEREKIVGEVRDTLLSVERKSTTLLENSRVLPLRLSDRTAVTVKVLTF